MENLVELTPPEYRCAPTTPHCPAVFYDVDTDSYVIIGQIDDLNLPNKDMAKIKIPSIILERSIQCQTQT